MCRKQLRIRSRRRGGALEGNREIIGRFAGDFAEATSFDRRRLCSRMELPGARGSESLAEITGRIRSSERCDTSSGPFCESCGLDATRPRAFHGASFASDWATRPCRHVRSRCRNSRTAGVCIEPGRLPASLRAATTTGQPRRLVIQSGLLALRRNREYRTARRSEPLRQGDGFAFGSSDVSATSAYDDQPRQRPHWRKLAGKPHRIPYWGTGCRLQSFRTSMLGNQCGAFPPTPLDGNTAASRAEKLVLGSAPLASHSSETGADDIAHYRLQQHKRRHPGSGTTTRCHEHNESISSRAR
jgi:hypothetical protein